MLSSWFLDFRFFCIALKKLFQGLKPLFFTLVVGCRQETPWTGWDRRRVCKFSNEQRKAARNLEKVSLRQYKMDCSILFNTFGQVFSKSIICKVDSKIAKQKHCTIYLCLHEVICNKKPKELKCAEIRHRWLHWSSSAPTNYSFYWPKRDLQNRRRVNFYYITYYYQHNEYDKCINPKYTICKYCWNSTFSFQSRTSNLVSHPEK